MRGYSNLTTSTGSEGGPSTILVRVLQEYDRQLPLDFVAMILGRTRAEVDRDVEGLERQGVAKRLGNEVMLVR
ncbi:MAG TPA: hypothetical protein VHO73_01510 [Methylomirabilota bacterium]|jgi:hypothetical protein|nr:hypothetical protein [Methylomirabilota bacterium]